MNQDTFLAPVTEKGQQVLDLIKINKNKAAELMLGLNPEEQISLVTRQATKDPLGAQELLFLLDDEKSKKIVEDLGDRTVFRIMKSQSSTHIGVLSLVKPERLQSILDLDQELFSTKGISDEQTAYHWLVSFMEEDEKTFSELLENIDIKVVASAFQDKIIKPAVIQNDQPIEEMEDAFPADFLVKLDRGELKPDDLEVTDEETLDILTKIYLTDEQYFNNLISLMLRDDELKSRAAEEALSRIQEQVGDIPEITKEAEDMFVPLDEDE
jgi:hypothetical protein